MNGMIPIVQYNLFRTSIHFLSLLQMNFRVKPRLGGASADLPLQI